ncbi:Transcriptional regulator, XRE family [Enterococcus mundtii 1A]|uniref:helix-turn-helix domain-containing protein n=1 Tax=Enterococcus mundtii TaxID=53346 RepID=UPI0023034425|nr:helix-turn-helix domain-containing protein [Enterococcus mundtii]MDA9429514.1 Transcriptional regulator, XRE family [Enterococcus mundtii 1A]MDO7879769.1 helix-turn-helix domain-containing protein [Enterococcus mundtii]MEC3941226.1 helix-turn-helix domain-containing protein [Enterococcus mundtii]
MDFGKTLKEKRHQAGITQEELAKRLNVSRSAISNWEIGRNYPDIHTLVKISTSLGVSLDELLENSTITDTMIDTTKEVEVNQKKKQGKLFFIVALCSIISVMSLLFFSFSKQPTIVLNAVENVNSEDVALFNKEDIKDITLKDKKMTVLFTIPKDSEYVGYYVDGSNQKGFVNLDLYKTANSNINQRKLVHDGLIEVDLDMFSKVNKISVNYKK